MGSSRGDNIEILPVSLLEEESNLVNDLKKLAKSLGIGLGWHYLLDLAWILREAKRAPQAKKCRGKKVVDAGAGEGLMQWYLAERGVDVISVDRRNRDLLCLRFRARYRIQGMRSKDLSPHLHVLSRNIRMADDNVSRGKALLRGIAGMALIAVPKVRTGGIRLYKSDLTSLTHIPNSSQDLVVAVSALEHNEPRDLACISQELMRVLKPGGMMLATLCAAKEKDWFHHPSEGWCYTEESLRRHFQLSPDAPSNYHRFDELFSEIKDCSELRDNLASFYYHSGKNGMPWGVWNPKYQPVGVRKIKPRNRKSGERQF
jgi:SAM-dependent methyltransferase